MPPLAIVAVAVLVVAFVVAVLSLRGDSGSGGDERGGGGGGIGPPRPGKPPPATPGWWPEFERDFAAYVAAHDRLATPSRGGEHRRRAHRHEADYRRESGIDPATDVPRPGADQIVT